jgi:hypothetical protein
MLTTLSGNEEIGDGSDCVKCDLICSILFFLLFSELMQFVQHYYLPVPLLIKCVVINIIVFTHI